MGENCAAISGLFFSADGEEWSAIAEVKEFPSFGAECLPVRNAPEEYTVFGGEEYTARLATPKWLRCNGKKRFIKLLMGKRIARNEAMFIAKAVQNAKMPYDTALLELMLLGGIKFENRN